MVEVNKLRYGNRSYKLKIPSSLIVPDRKRIINHTKYVLDADIQSCFDDISHE
jgi:retron-type reverse transcriptase